MASVIDRIRESMQYVKSSQGRMEKFNAMIARVGLACKNHPSLDVPTRWNSTYLMLESSLPFRAAFEALKETDKDYKSAPSASEWEMAEAICHLLGAFYTATKKISGRTYPTSHMYFYEVWNVKQIKEKEVISENPTIVAMVKEMEEKWMKYFEESFLTSSFGGGAEKYLTKVNSAMKILFAEYSSKYENTSDEGDEVAEEDVPAEAAFSNAGRIITTQRSSLTPSTVETLMCLEDWFRAADRQKAESTVGDRVDDQNDAGKT
ncbi:zinc finger BED domain-containing protein RICESLEEPER 2-like [Aegilops tauschii subsp. strangulata]|uniref:zinc finger BED domain-containing protein RICESLEEPER 2-like n=1 Tax=Aegilops tauschii subsp. strangulata TaxID=200361 RepID=UPI001E1CAE8B|nr:zinc finger BED domain-containing protein RICESLEEPER 2-like [Aegilops tauschii subsp. strangulata]